MNQRRALHDRIQLGTTPEELLQEHSELLEGRLRETDMKDTDYFLVTSHIRAAKGLNATCTEIKVLQ